MTFTSSVLWRLPGAKSNQGSAFLGVGADPGKGTETTERKQMCVDVNMR